MLCDGSGEPSYFWRNSPNNTGAHERLPASRHVVAFLDGRDDPPSEGGERNHLCLSAPSVIPYATAAPVIILNGPAFRHQLQGGGHVQAGLVGCLLYSLLIAYTTRSASSSEYAGTSLWLTRTRFARVSDLSGRRQPPF